MHACSPCSLFDHKEQLFLVIGVFAFNLEPFSLRLSRRFTFAIGGKEISMFSVLIIPGGLGFVLRLAHPARWAYVLWAAGTIFAAAIFLGAGNHLWSVFAWVGGATILGLLVPAFWAGLENVIRHRRFMHLVLIIAAAALIGWIVFSVADPSARDSAIAGAALLTGLYAAWRAIRPRRRVSANGS